MRCYKVGKALWEETNRPGVRASAHKFVEFNCGQLQSNMPGTVDGGVYIKNQHCIRGSG